jgi:hypothetical protein
LATFASSIALDEQDNAMQDGLYAVTFVTPLGEGGGVVVKSGDQLRGGDSGFSYVGHLEERGDALEASVHVSKHSISEPSVFGPLTDFDLKLVGRGSGTTGQLKGRSPQAPGIEMQLQIRKLAA